MARDERDEDDDVSEDAGATSIRLERLARLIRQAGHAEGLLPVHWEILRFLARASRHSLGPGAVTGYLGLTKGTTSQSLAALERKGLITRQKQSTDQRHQILALTETGRILLQKDPLAGLERRILSLGGKTRRRFDRGLADLLDHQIEAQKAQRFGTCAGCRHFKDKGCGALCALDGLPLSGVESHLLCGAYVAE
jgi:DNA-binding MarR family transcriptional regulator